MPGCKGWNPSWCSQILSSSPRRWRNGNNTVLREAAARDPQVAFVDWAALVATHPGVLGPDGVHPGPRGRALLAGAVADAVHR